MAVVVAGCSSNYVWDTNFDQQKIDDYFKPSKVQLVNQISETATLVADLTAERCYTELPVEEQIFVELRTELRRKAADLNANRLIVDLCEIYHVEDNRQCPLQPVCNARAFVEEN